MSKIPVWSWRGAIRKSSMSTGAKCLCFAISCYLNDAGGYAWPHVTDLMKDTSCSNKTIARHIQEAINAGFLRIKRMHDDKGHVYGTRYYPMFPANATLATDVDETENEDRTDSLSEKSSSRDDLSVESTLRDKSLGVDLSSLGVDLSSLGVESTRHKSPYNSQNTLSNTEMVESKERPDCLNKKLKQTDAFDTRNQRSKLKRNVAKTHSARFETFWAAYKAAANGMHGAKVEAAAEYDRLSEEDQDAALAALPMHRRKLGETKFKHACRYLSFRQFDEYAEEVQAATRPPSEEDIIRDIVSDLMAEPSVPNWIRRHGWASFGALKQEAPDLFWRAVDYAKRECYWTPRGAFKALAA